MNRAAVIIGGPVVSEGTLADLKQRVERRVSVALELRGDYTLPVLDGVVIRERAPGKVEALFERQHAGHVLQLLMDQFGPDAVTDFAVKTPSLEDVYMMAVQGQP